MTRILTREGINRMVGNSRSAQGSQSSRGGGGGGGQAVSLANLTDVAISTPIDGGSVLTFDETAGKWVAGPGYATETWVSQNYISIAYFDRLFRAYNGNTLVSHNDETSTIDNIKAMFGFWTEQYLSALGNSGGGSVSLTIANMGDVALNNLADGQILVYDATEGKWVNESASIVGNYLPLTGGTLTGDLFFTGYNNRVFGIKRTSASAGQSIGTNIDIGWDWDNRDGAGAFFRSVEAGTLAGDFGFFARNANNVCELLGKPDGTLTWGNNPILTSANIKTINGESIYGSGNIVVGGGGSAYLPLTGGTMTGNISLTQGVYIRSGGYALLAYHPSGVTGISNTQWGGGATDSQGVIRSNKSDLLHYRGGSGAASYAILDEYNATTILNNSYLPLTGGTLSGRLTINAGVLNITGETSYAQGIRIHDSGGYSSIFFRCTGVTGASNGMWGITAYSSGFGIRGTSSANNNTLNYYLSIAYGGNVGIGTTSPSYKLHVNGTLGAGNTSVANLESEGYVSALSDIRKKKVVEYMEGLTIEQIASMPIIKFTWKDRPEEGLQVGSVAQEWEKILPQSVHKSKNDYLSFSYGVAALVSSISTARKVFDHEKRIAELERENKELKLKLNIA